MTKEELEKEAGDYADKHAFRVPYDGSSRFYDDVDFKASKEGYLAGAKPREKRISELKEVCQDLSDKFDYQVKQVMRLEKENAELKEKLKPENCLKLLAKDGYVKFTSEQLTKAKELLKRWQQANICDATVLFSQTEDFLKEE